MACCLIASMSQASEASAAYDLAGFIDSNCLDCHAGESAEAGLDLERMVSDADTRFPTDRWAKVHDRVKAGEMPPPDYGSPDQPDRDRFVVASADRLRRADKERQATEGRTVYRRLNRVEYENTLRDLLRLPNLEVAGMLPPDSSAYGFDKVGSALDVSHVQLARYLEAAGAAIDQAMGPVLQHGERPETQVLHLDAKTNGRLEQVLRKGKEAVPVGEAVGLLRQPNTAQAPWWWSKFSPTVDGTYRIRMKTHGFVWDRGEVLPADQNHVVTYYALRQTTKRPLGTFDIGPSADQASIHEFDAHLRVGEQLQFWLETLSDQNRGNTPMEEYVAPGVAVEWLEIEGPLFPQWPPASYRQLFGDLPVQDWDPDSNVQPPPLPIHYDGVGKRAKLVQAKPGKTTLRHVVSRQPDADARRLLLRFANRTLRRSVGGDEIRDIVELVQARLDAHVSFQEAMRVGYQAILCSPEFLFLDESPGQLSDFALASRLSYFLWNSLPDDELRRAASRNELHRADVLSAQVERMLNDPKANRFVEDFCGQWLDLRRITVTQPDEQLYPEFDQFLLDSMVRETRRYFAEMVRDDLGADHLVGSDFLMINERLAELYEIDGVEGCTIRKVDLPADSPRGGFLTQASVLKVTANGTTTSPVTRGAWVLDRLYGRPPLPPPPNVPAVEPDLRGATTIRRQLEKHRDDEACATCHRAIDPPGFALESFDVIGTWRDRYRALENGEPPQVKEIMGKPVVYKLGLPVDGSGVDPGGESFEDVHEFRAILLSRKETLAKNLAERLVVYSTGAGIDFADRDAIAKILNETRDTGFGLRSIIHAVVQSDLFQRK